jgi:hypothetical protein
VAHEPLGHFRLGSGENGLAASHYTITGHSPWVRRDYFFDFSY